MHEVEGPACAMGTSVAAQTDPPKRARRRDRTGSKADIPANTDSGSSGLYSDPATPAAAPNFDGLASAGFGAIFMIAINQAFTRARGCFLM